MLIQKWVSKEYAKIYLENRISTQKEEKKIMEDFCERYGIKINGGKILDLAWWPWVDTNIFCKLWAKKVLYHDKYQEYIDIAKRFNKKYEKNIEFCKWDMNDVDYIKDNSLDFIYCNVSFYYSKNDVLLLKKLSKKLKKWWHMYIITLDSTKFWHLSFLQMILFSFFHLLYEITNYKLVTLPYNNLSNLRSIAQKNGLQEIYYKKPRKRYKRGDARAWVAYVLRQKK